LERKELSRCRWAIALRHDRRLLRAIVIAGAASTVAVAATTGATYYNAGHQLNAQAVAERKTWLLRQLGTG
jgi:hypothetical protein